MSKRAAWAPVAAVTGARLAPVRSALRSSDPARRAQFDALLERRRVHWSMKSEHPRLLGNWGAALPSQGWFWGVLLLMVWFLAIAFDESYGVLVLFGGMVLMLGAPVLWTWRVGRFARNAIHRQRCPHCAYDLRGLDPGFPEIPIAGPEICPECAHAWPLVPPPTPNEIHARLDHRAKALTPPVCDACGYALDGLRGHICPECGCEQDTA
jgi:ribosomal protein L34E